MNAASAAPVSSSVAGWSLWAPGGRALVLGIAAILLVRLATLGSYPLMDTSEARYGEIARVMLETGNFVTPQEVPGTPFWAKPPLYAWLSAGSMGLLGVSEFALRLPSFLCALCVLALCCGWSASLSPVSPEPRPPDWRAPLLTLGLLSTSILFFVSAGAVMTDPSLAACTTGMLAAFHHTVIRGSRAVAWRYGFFVAAGLGMLAKGPVILLYAGAPIIVWSLWLRRLAAAWGALPWLVGTALAALICVPWYALAELRTPGFLQYFLLGEHVMRFVQPGWGGDLYGNAHAEPLGTIWLYLAAAMGANSLLLLGALAASARDRLLGARAPDPGRLFLLLAAAIPLAFFTFAGNIIWTYVLPPLGPLAVLVADVCARRAGARGWRHAAYAALAVSGISLVVAVFAWVPRHVAAHSSAALVAQWRERDRLAPGALVYLGRKAPASLRFYSQGAVRAAPDLAQALEGIRSGSGRYLAVAPSRAEEVQRYAAALPAPLVAQEIAANSDLALLWLHAERAP